MARPVHMVGEAALDERTHESWGNVRERGEELGMRSAKVKVLTAAAALIVMGGLCSTASAGSIFLTGHDPDFHAQLDSGAQNLLAKALNYVTVGTYNTTGTKFLWVESRISPPGGHLIGEDGLAAIGLTLGTHYDRADGAEFASVDLSQYTAIAIASSFGGLLTRTELDALIARSADIKTFINAGGGLFASSERDGQGADLLGVNPDVFGYLPVIVTSQGNSGPYTVTPYGSATFGLTNGDLNSPTHNSFGLVGGLNVVDTDATGAAVTLAGNVNIGGGGFTAAVPLPSSFFLGLVGGLVVVGLGTGRRRKSGDDTCC